MAPLLICDFVEAFLPVSADPLRSSIEGLVGMREGVSSSSLLHGIQRLSVMNSRVGF
ncbi:hypothetical protein [Stygiolobus caldivivus]|uniref:Uncharacterized protein n=1 Tax=Stygiolobus caldivivus TaxID=2824673 RepID=A0A8D5U7L5_9CREN|nr:hypothetical protein [Stygiolobus caldivivus]BCU70296.1 hypothetical protein KN1_15930 [Stygiolobus caldivivus]